MCNLYSITTNQEAIRGAIPRHQPLTVGKPAKDQPTSTERFKAALVLFRIAA
jgi:hypothetical protein